MVFRNGDGQSFAGMCIMCFMWDNLNKQIMKPQPFIFLELTETDKLRMFSNTLVYYSHGMEFFRLNSVCELLLAWQCHLCYFLLVRDHPHITLSRYEGGGGRPIYDG